MCNHEKFQLMTLGSKHKNKQMKIDVMNNDIESHSEMKLLGVTIDEHLNFSRHIGEVCKNASRKVGVLMRLRNMLTTSAKLKIFISLIMPQIHIQCSISVGRRIAERWSEYKSEH